MQEGMERADEPAEPEHDQLSVVFPPPPLVARVIVGPVPAVPLASLAAYLEPVVDDEGRTVDWRFNRDGAYDAADLKASAEWRGSWERTWELGPLTNLRTLQRVVAQLGNVPSVAALLGALAADPEATRIEPSKVPTLPAELDAVRAAIAAESHEGMAIVDQDPAPAVERRLLTNVERPA